MSDQSNSQQGFCYAEGDEGAQFCGASKSMHCSVLGEAVTREHLVKCMRDDHFIHHAFIASQPVPADAVPDKGPSE